MEVIRVCEEWEYVILSKENVNFQLNDEDVFFDVYCFELFFMVLVLSGFNVGWQYLVQQLILFQDFFLLFYIVFFRVQRQVIFLLRRVLFEVIFNCLVSIIGVKFFFLVDISDIIYLIEKGDWNKLGILDMFLGCIVKVFIVQLKVKGIIIIGIVGIIVGKGVIIVIFLMIFNFSYF